MSDRIKLMTVNELIAALQQFDGNLPVYLECDDDYYSDPMYPERLELGKIALSPGGRYKNDDTGGMYTVQPHWTSHIDGRHGEPVDCLKIIAEG